MANFNVVLDLGSSCLKGIFLKGGYIIKDPSVVLCDAQNGQFKASGLSALQTYASSSSQYKLTRPIQEGAVKDKESAAYLLENFLHKLTGKAIFSSITVNVIVPCGLSKNDKGVIDSVLSAIGVKQVKFLLAPLCAAKRLFSEFEADIAVVLDIGADTTDIAIVREGQIEWGCTVFAGGSALDKEIEDFISDRYGVIISSEEAANLKINCASLYPNDNSMLTVEGMNVVKGFDEEINVTAREMYNIISENIKRYAQAIQMALPNLPQDSLSSVKREGIILCGGTAGLSGIDKFLLDTLRLPVRISANAVDAAVLGGLALVRGEL